MASQPIRTDVAIAGGGMVGLTLALALAQGGMKVVIADPMTPAQLLDERFDGRVSALAFASVRMMRMLGVWDTLAPDAQPINDILVSDGELGGKPSPFSLHFDHREIGEVARLHRREPPHQARAARAVEAQQGNPLSRPASRSKALRSARPSTTLNLSDGQEIACPLAVAAEGRESPLREAQGIRSVALGLSADRYRDHGRA